MKKLPKSELFAYVVLLAIGIGGPLLFPNYITQIAVMWIMVLFAQTWDAMGGRMGYNSLGNILFFGAGMYICAVTQIGLYYDVGAYTVSSGAVHVEFTNQQYFTGIFAGIALAAVGSALLAASIGWMVFGLRGPYFAIGTLGIALAAGELFGAWGWVGGGGGIAMPVFPGEGDEKAQFFYWMC